MPYREMSRETFRELMNLTLTMKRSARQNGDIEGLRNAERCNALLMNLAIDIHFEDLKASDIA